MQAGQKGQAKEPEDETYQAFKYNTGLTRPKIGSEAINGGTELRGDGIDGAGGIGKIATVY